MPNTIHIPTEKAMSSLDGISLNAIDTDPNTNVVMMVNGILNPPIGEPLELVAVLPFKFHGVRRGYLVVTYDRTADPRAAEPGE